MSIYYIVKSVQAPTLHSCVLNVSKLVGISLLSSGIHSLFNDYRLWLTLGDYVFVVFLEPIFWS